MVAAAVTGVASLVKEEQEEEQEEDNLFTPLLRNDHDHRLQFTPPSSREEELQERGRELEEDQVEVQERDRNVAKVLIDLL